MDRLTKNRVFSWIIIILLIVNISALSTIIYHGFFHKNRTFRVIEPQEGFGGRFLKDELNLSSAQREEFKTSRTYFFQHTRPLFDSLMKKRIDIANEISSKKPDTLKLYKLADEWGNLHSQLKKQTIRHFLQMKSYCNPAQQEKLSGFFNDILMCDEPMHGRGMKFHHGSEKNINQEMPQCPPNMPPPDNEPPK